MRILNTAKASQVRAVLLKASEVEGSTDVEVTTVDCEALVEPQRIVMAANVAVGQQPVLYGLLGLIKRCMYQGVGLSSALLVELMQDDQVVFTYHVMHLPGELHVIWMPPGIEEANTPLLEAVVLDRVYYAPVVGREEIVREMLTAAAQVKRWHEEGKQERLTAAKRASEQQPAQEQS